MHVTTAGRAFYQLASLALAMLVLACVLSSPARAHVGHHQHHAADHDCAKALIDVAAIAPDHFRTPPLAQQEVAPANAVAIAGPAPRGHGICNCAACPVSGMGPCCCPGATAVPASIEPAIQPPPFRLMTPRLAAVSRTHSPVPLEKPPKSVASA
jgi:hypothetical protein